MSRSVNLAILLLIGFATRVAAQDQPSQVLIRDSTAPEAFIGLQGFSSDYQVGPGDQLDIRFIGYDDLRESVRVSNSGEINVPMLGPVPVMDMSTFEIEDEIARRLQEAALVRKPEVLVSVQEYNAKPIYVMGAVTSPGQFIMSQALTVADGVLLAGGLRFNAGDEAVLYRRGASTEGATVSPAALAAGPGVARPGIEVVRVDLRPFKQGRFHESATPLRRGDVLVVPDRVFQQFFVVGELVQPGNFAYSPGKTLMASQAISWAGGPTFYAKMSDGILVRYDAQGNRTEKPVDWGAILNGRQPDFPIQPNDIIFVPNSKGKTLTRGLVDLAANMTAMASFRIARTYQLPDAPELPSRPQQ